MSYGMRIWGADGALQLNENSFTMRVVFSTVVSRSQFSGQSIITYPVDGITPGNSVALLVPIGAYADLATQFESEVINGAARVYNYLRGYATANTSSVDSMRLIVIRFA
jgi:hypothetical protein